MALMEAERQNHLMAGQQQRFHSHEDDEKACWICLTTDQDDDHLSWVQPCRCRGSTKWVHQHCLALWIDENRRSNPHGKVICTQCQTEYIIFMTEITSFAQMLEQFEVKLKYLSNYVVGGFFVGMLYWTAVTYGAFTFIQVLGREQAVSLLLNTDRILMLSALPAIPVGLVMLRLMPWDGMLYRIICHANDFGRMLSFDPELETTADIELDIAELEPVLHPHSATCITCGALVLPSVSCLAGVCLFPFMANPLHRAVLGGMTVLVIESLLRLYLRHQQYRRRMSRVVVDYNEENLSKLAGQEMPRVGAQP